jgi:hypothetical protein
MTMAREGTPAAAIVDRIQRAIPDPESASRFSDI